MVYIVQVECSFIDKNDAFSFVNELEKMKAKAFKETRPVVSPELSIKRICKVWESTHDEQSPKQCKLILSVDFDETVKNHS